MATYPVKWYASEMQGAPNLGDDKDGALAALLKAVLVTGFGTLTVNALSFDAAKGWAVATITAGHAYLQDSVIQVDGVSPAAYNGEHRVMQVTATQVWFELDNGNPGAPGNGAAMTMKVAPLGWTITHESGDGKIFIVRPANVSESGNVSLRIDNSAWSGWTGPNVGTYPMYLAKAQLVEDVVDINTFTTIHDHRWPCTGRYSNKRWDIIGDSQLFYFIPAYGTNNAQSVYAFGYIRSVRPGDRYHAILQHYYSASPGASTVYSWLHPSVAYYGTFGAFDDANQRAIARPYHQLFGVTSWWLKGLFGRLGNGMAIPNGPDNGVYLSIDQLMVMESGNHLRGYMPGLICPYGTIAAWDRKNFGSLPALPNKLVRFLRATYDPNPQAYPPVLMGFDLTGPWR